jgi:hypothetical protein
LRTAFRRDVFASDQRQGAVEREPEAEDAAYEEDCNS